MFDRFFAQLERDPNVDDDVRAELLRELESAPDADREAVILAWCRRHQLKGPVCAEAKGRVLGHVVSLQRLHDDLGSAANATTPLSFRSGRSLGRALLARDLEGQKLLLGERPLRRYLMWSFFEPESSSDATPPLGLGEAEFTERLALEERPKLRPYLVWGHEVQPPVQSRVPTICEAEFHPRWKPGGLTDGTPPLAEVVHSPIKSEALRERIREVKP